MTGHLLVVHAIGPGIEATSWLWHVDLAGFFGMLTSIAVLTVGGQLGGEDLMRSHVFALVCVVGLVLSIRAGRCLDGYSLRPILLAVSAAAAIGMLVREWMR